MEHQSTHFVGAIEFTKDISLQLEKVLGIPFKREYKKGEIVEGCEVVSYYSNNILTANLMIDEYISLGNIADFFIELSERQVTITRILSDINNEKA